MHPSSNPGHVGSESDLHFRGLYSFTNFYLMEGRYDFKMPAIGQADVTKSRRFEDQVTLSIFVSRVNLAKQNFYGIGPNTTLGGLAVYRQLQDKLALLPIGRFSVGSLRAAPFSYSCQASKVFPGPPFPPSVRPMEI